MTKTDEKKVPVQYMRCLGVSLDRGAKGGYLATFQDTGNGPAKFTFYCSKPIFHPGEIWGLSLTKHADAP